MRKQADLNLMAFDLGQHTGVLKQMVSGNQINRIMAAHCLSASCANSGRPLRWLPALGWHMISNSQFVQYLRMRFGVPTVLPLGGWRCDCRPRGRAETNGALDFERLEEMQHGDVMLGVRLEDEPFHGLCCRARQVRLIQRHDAIRDLLANALNALEEVTVVSTEPALPGEGSHGQRGDIKMVANGTEYILDVTVACPATRHMTRTHNTGAVPGAAGGVAQAHKRQKYGTRLQPLVFETGGRVHRDTLQFVHDKLVNAPAGVEAREKNRVAMARIYGKIAECLDRHSMRCMASLIRELARRRRRREQERQLGHAMPAGHHRLDDEEENDDGAAAEVAVLPLQGNVWVV